MESEERKNLYHGYSKLASNLPACQGEIFDWIRIVAPCIRYVLTQMLAWEISHRRPRGPWGDWFTAERIIRREFSVEENGQFDMDILFLLLALKCVFLGAYGHLRACYENLPCLYEEAAPGGYINDERALEILGSLDSGYLEILAESACRISSRDMDLLFYLSGEVEYLLGKAFD